MNVLDLFSGIGGFSLGLERAGFTTVAFCEIEPYCRAVLRKHWPHVPCYEDVRTLTAEQLRADGISVDVICGGFPCQDISFAGKGAGIEGERSGLWREYARLIGELRPRYVIVENVAALLGRGLDVVLGDLAALGFDAEWHCIPASAVGAPHRRDRVWIIAHPRGQQHEGNRAPLIREIAAGFYETVADAASERCGEARQHSKRHSERPARCRQVLGHASEARRADVQGSSQAEGRNGDGAACGASLRDRGSHDWRTEPDVGRVAHGVPARVDRLKSLGNAVVPQIPEIIGRAIMNAKSAQPSGAEVES